MERTRKRLIQAAAAAIVILLAALAFRPTPVSVETAVVERGELVTTIEAEAVTRVRERYRVVAPVSGRLERLTLQEGDEVRGGDVVARIMPLPLDSRAVIQANARLAMAEASLAGAKARADQAARLLDQARRNAERIRSVAEAGGVSRQQREQAELELANAEREHDAARANVRAAEGEVLAARAALLDVDPDAFRGRAATEVRAPAAGTVLRIPDRSERIVAAGEPILELGDLSSLEVVIDVLSTDAVRIQPGARILLEQWGGGTPLEARVDRVEPAAFTRVSALGVEEQRVNVIGEFVGFAAGTPRPGQGGASDAVSVPREPGRTPFPVSENQRPILGDGYRADARIVVEAAADVLKAPASALFRTGQDWSVFVVENDRARLRIVEVGRRGTAEVEILSGLDAGDRVLLYPSDQVRDGTKVRSRAR